MYKRWKYYFENKNQVYQERNTHSLVNNFHREQVIDLCEQNIRKLLFKWVIKNVLVFKYQYREAFFGLLGIPIVINYQKNDIYNFDDIVKELTHG